MVTEKLNPETIVIERNGYRQLAETVELLFKPIPVWNTRTDPPTLIREDRGECLGCLVRLRNGQEIYESLPMEPASPSDVIELTESEDAANALWEEMKHARWGGNGPVVYTR